MRLIIISCLVFFTTQTLAQKQTENWLFSEYEHFAIGEGVFIKKPSSPMLAPEGSSSISDTAGDLQFYSNGATVWNKNHQIMDNGDSLIGNISSTQSSLIIRRPESGFIYYLLTNNSIDGLYYSIIDLSLNGGLGKVVRKNLKLWPSVTEKLTSCFHANGKDVWVVSHEWTGQKFVAFLLTKNSFHPAVISSIGHNFQFLEMIGQLKLSPSGRFLVSVSFGNGIAELFFFNNKTGRICNSTILSDTLYGVYGAEFSPDEKFVYCMTAGRQIDLLTRFPILPSGNAGSIETIDFTANIGGSMQLAADNSIYIKGYKYLGIIRYPDSALSKMEYIDTFYSFSPPYDKAAGLPNFNQGLFNKSSTYGTIYCDFVEDSITLFIPNIITPNGDYINDVFIIGGSQFAEYNLEVYNRWGSLVFNTQVEDNYFDGTTNGQKLADGVYYYILNFRLPSSSKIDSKHGTVTILTE